ncbi:hypothetical protein N7456_013575 [Penicillium angulare]|uniref:Mid2 domain-containing protein n=1 Tax=Penicillium angulare TaxID=116970 RepID=A0A9W9JT00_9EURO|nr:hypothetical protein N7456_013575 [Penicillium angulare]
MTEGLQQVTVGSITPAFIDPTISSEYPETTVVYITSTAEGADGAKSTDAEVIFVYSTLSGGASTATIATHSATSASDSTTASSGNKSGTSSSGSSLSSGAAAGIGIGATVAVVLLAALAWFIFRRRSRNQKMAGNLSNNVAPKHELSAAEVKRAAELDIDGQKHELHGDANDKRRAGAPLIELE